MSDHVFYPLAALIAVALIVLALVWPQGTGVRSPSPFGHPVVAQGQIAGPRAATQPH